MEEISTLEPVPLYFPFTTIYLGTFNPMKKKKIYLNAQTTNYTEEEIYFFFSGLKMTMFILR